MTGGDITQIDWKALFSVLGILLTIGVIVWTKDRKISKAEEDKRNADLKRIEDANQLRDSQSLVNRANEYWRRFTGRPPGSDT